MDDPFHDEGKWTDLERETALQWQKESLKSPQSVSDIIPPNVASTELEVPKTQDEERQHRTLRTVPKFSSSSPPG
jgi:hypothetical protein